MKFQIKLFRWPDRGNHVIIIARGFINTDGLEQIFRNVAETTQSLVDCKVLIDLLDATYRFEAADINAFVSRLSSDSFPNNSKIALVSAREIEPYDQLHRLSTCLSPLGLKIAAFYDSNMAVDWLAETI